MSYSAQMLLISKLMVVMIACMLPKPVDSSDSCDWWCQGYNAPWGAKCAWSSGACTGCAECGPHPIAKCEGWCNDHASGWSDKCMWSSLACAKCGPCSPLGYPDHPGLLSVTSGKAYCHIDSSGCVTDGVGTYRNYEACTVMANQDITVSATFFETESDYDHITIGTNVYSGVTGPSNVAMAAGSKMTWESDYSDREAGFVICPTAV